MANVTCPQCGHEMRFKDAAVSRVVKCRECETKLRVPAAENSDSSPVEPRRRGRSKGPDQRLEKRLRLDDHTAEKERQPAPEWTLPAVLIGIGLLLTLVGAGLAVGSDGVAGALVYVAFEILFSVPLGIAAMFLIASLLGVSFGSLGLAILRLAAISVFTIGIVSNCYLAGWIVTGYLIAIPIGYVLFSYFFDLSLFETMISLFIIGLAQKMVGLLLATMLASLSGRG